jgi:glutamate dehydrogenase
VVLIVDRTGKPIETVVATYVAAQGYFKLDRIAAAAHRIAVSDYFDRLALDRARDTIGDAERRITAAMVGTGKAGEAAVQAWVEPRRAEVERVRDSVHQIANSGLTLSKLSVAASLLGDLVKQ